MRTTRFGREFLGLNRVIQYLYITRWFTLTKNSHKNRSTQDVCWVHFLLYTISLNKIVWELAAQPCPTPFFVRKNILLALFVCKNHLGGGGKFHLELVVELRLNYSWNLSLRAVKSLSPRSETKTKKPKKHVFFGRFPSLQVKRKSLSLAIFEDFRIDQYNSRRQWNIW